MKAKRTPKQILKDAIRYLDYCECAGTYGRGTILKIISELKILKSDHDNLKRFFDIWETWQVTAEPEYAEQLEKLAIEIEGHQ